MVRRYRIMLLGFLRGLEGGDGLVGDRGGVMVYGEFVKVKRNCRCVKDGVCM